jgi:ATP-binding cassette subfamily C protein
MSEDEDTGPPNNAQGEFSPLDKLNAAEGPTLRQRLDALEETYRRDAGEAYIPKHEPAVPEPSTVKAELPPRIDPSKIRSGPPPKLAAPTVNAAAAPELELSAAKVELPPTLESSTVKSEPPAKLEASIVNAATAPELEPSAVKADAPPKLEPSPALQVAPSPKLEPQTVRAEPPPKLEASSAVKAEPAPKLEPQTVKAESVASPDPTASASKPSTPARDAASAPSAARKHEADAGDSGGAGQSAAPLHRRFVNHDFRQALGPGLRGVRTKLIIVAFFSFWVNSLILGIPIYLFNISDRVLTSRSVDTLIMLTIVIGGAVFGHVVLDMVRRFILMRVAVEVECRLGAPVLAAAARASIGGSSREFQTLSELQQLRNFITGPVLLIMFDAPVVPVYILAVFLIHPELGWIVTATGVTLLGFALINQKLTAVPFAQSSAYASRANLQADAMARNSQVINAMGMIPESVMIWGRETIESLKAQVTAQDRNIVMAALSKFVRQGTQVMMLGWGAALALDGKLTGGMMIAASIVGGRALAPIENVIDGWRSFIHARTAYQRIRTLLLNSPLNADRLQLPRPTGRLDVERILYVPQPSKKVILNGVTFSLAPGELLAIVGASGTGKSTLARMLVGSIAPTAGSVRLDMMDLRNWNERQLGETIGYLPQDVQLFPASIKANIARMREDATDEAVYDAAEAADVHELISQFPHGYETVVAMDGSPLSGGQRQRIGLARAFFGNPRLVVLDEPNSNLDTPGEMALARALERAKQRGSTVIAITQRPALLQSVDKIMILREGAIQAMGSRQEMMPHVLGRAPDPSQRAGLAAAAVPAAVPVAG